MKILIAYSGGLDTSYLIARLSRAGHEVVAATVDCGGFDDDMHAELAQRALGYGALSHHVIDARVELFERVLRWLVAGNVLRGRTYPLSVGAERGVQAERLAHYALEGGFDALAHGCTAAGNDQVRFDGTLRVVAPGLKVLAPIRDEAPTRDEQIAWLTKEGLALPGGGGGYSINAGLWGQTIGGGALLGSEGELPEDAWSWTRCGPTAAQRVEITFERGIPVALDGRALEPVPLIEQLNRDAGAAGVGRGIHLGDTVLGIKGRVAFESPAAMVLIEAHRELEKLVLTEDQRFWKDHLGDVYGRRVHEGRHHDPLLRDIEAMFESSQARVSGRVTVGLEGRVARTLCLDSPHSMMRASDAAYGERAASDADPAGLVTFARVSAEPSALYARAAGTGVPS